MEALINVGFVFLLGLIGLVFGSWNERKHYRSIVAREAQLKHILVFNEKRPPLEVTGLPFHLVQGSVVVSSDYFKNIAAGLRSFFGGRLSVYETLLDRARREAVLRMKAEAQARGANIVVNVLFETCNLTQQQPGAIVSCEVLVYGTAWALPRPAGHEAAAAKGSAQALG
jgi:uncharacterized protein YbjQ (UPF0145 family)